MKYCDLIDVENYLLIEVKDSFKSQVEDWIEGVSRMVDTLANRKLVAEPFGSGDDYEVKYYDGNGRKRLTIDDAQEIDIVKIDGIETTATPYPKVPPYRALINEAGFDRGDQNVEVYGRFGLFNEVPLDIKLACAIIVAGIINVQVRKINKTSEKIGSYSVTYADDKGMNDYVRAIQIIESYRKYEI